jgi:Holliday junction DNA helicase RuvB
MGNLSTPPPKIKQPRPTSPNLTEEDKTLDLTLRPRVWRDYVGQEKVKKNIQIIIEAAKKRGEPIEHLLFYGGSGLGKTTISYVVANEIGTNIRVVSGPAIEKAGDLAAILTNLAEGDILFLDECHRMNKICEEYLYSAMEDYKLNLILGKGPMARTMELKLPRFTLIGATTRLALLSSPLRNRFGATFQLNFYGKEDIEKIIQRSSKLLEVKIEPQALKIIAQRSRLTPRVANRLLKRVRDFAQVEGEGIITEKIAKEALEFLEIDEEGLESGDRKILEAIIKKFEGGPVGLQSLSAATSEEEDTILDIYEPYLMQLGFIERTPRGRTATKLAYQHLGIKYKGSQKFLLQ